MVPAVAANVPAVVPAATVTVAGTESAALSLLTATAAPPAGATCESVTVQVLLPPEPRLTGLHTSEDTVTGANNEIDADPAVLLYRAVTVAV